MEKFIKSFTVFASILLLIFILAVCVFSDFWKELTGLYFLFIFFYFLRVALTCEIKGSEIFPQKGIKKKLIDLACLISQLIYLPTRKDVYEQSIDVLESFYKIFFAKYLSMPDVNKILTIYQETIKIFNNYLILLKSQGKSKNEAEMIKNLSGIKEQIKFITSQYIDQNCENVPESQSVLEKFGKRFCRLISIFRIIDLEKVIFDQEESVVKDVVNKGGVVLLRKKRKNILDKNVLKENFFDSELFFVLEIENFSMNNDFGKPFILRKIKLLSLRTGKEVIWRYNLTTQELFFIDFRRVRKGEIRVELACNYEIPFKTVNFFDHIQNRSNIIYNQKGKKTFYRCSLRSGYSNLNQESNDYYCTIAEYRTESPYFLIIENYSKKFTAYNQIYFSKMLSFNDVDIVIF